MAELTEKEFKVLNQEVERGGLTYTELQNELLDHLCCDVEAKMEEGLEFLKALEEVKTEMGSKPMQRVQEDTLLLINQKYRMMKKFMYILGITAPLLIIIGTVFKTMHWPGASILLTLGLTLLALVYLPVFASVQIRDTRDEGKKVNRWLYILGVIAGIVFIAGALFKIMHWPGAAIMISLAAIVTVAVFIPMLVINAIRSKENQVQNFTVLIFVLCFVAITYMSFALRVSKDTLDAFVLVAQDNVQNEALVSQNNMALGAAIMILELPEAKKVLAKEVIRQADDIDAYVDEVLYDIIKVAELNDFDEVVSESGEIRFELIKRKDDTSVPGEIMIIGIHNDGGAGIILKKKLDEFKKLVLEVKGTKDPEIEKILDTSDKEIHKEFNTSWESFEFEHLPMMGVLCQLTNIQLQISLVEGQLLSSIIDETEDKLEIL